MCLWLYKKPRNVGIIVKKPYLVLSSFLVAATVIGCSTDETTAVNQSKNKTAEINKQPDPKKYIYYLTDQKIKEAIKLGEKDTTDTSSYIQDKNAFDIPLKHSSLDVPITAKIDTPYSDVSVHAWNEMSQFHEHLSLEKAKEDIEYDRISFTFFKDEDDPHINFSFDHDVHLEQNGKIILPFDELHSKFGTWKSVYFRVAAIDFSKPVKLKVINKKDNKKYAEFNVDFARYVK